MASGKTFDMLALNRQFRWRVIEDRPARERDRSLRGKARIKARKASNKTATV
jgi:hypothetical protein